MGAKRHLNDECVYVFSEGSGWVIIGTHVDDMFPLFNREGRALRDKIFSFLGKHMTLENKGILSFALDTKIERDAEAGILKISQPTYIAGSFLNSPKKTLTLGKPLPPAAIFQKMIYPGPTRKNREQQSYQSETS